MDMMISTIEYFEFHRENTIFMCESWKIFRELILKSEIRKSLFQYLVDCNFRKSTLEMKFEDWKLLNSNMKIKFDDFCSKMKFWKYNLFRKKVLESVTK